MTKKFFLSCLQTAFCLQVVLLLNSCSSNDKIELIQHEERIDIMTDGKLITSYLHGYNLSKPILFPLKSTSGEVITRWYPFKEIEGESNDHPHQAGLFFTYGLTGPGDVNGNGFWANPHDRAPLSKEEKTPSIRQQKIIEIKEGRGKGRLVTLNHWIDRHEKPILEENRTMEFYAMEDEYKINFTIRLTAIDTTVTFKDTKEGMFAIRVADWLAENTRGKLFSPTGQYLNAEGEKTDKEVWGKRSSWVRLEGEKDDKKVGVAIFHHPESINYPTYWHARGYGCFSANPIGRYDFQKDRGLENPQYRSLILKPGETALFRFRVVIYEGPRIKEQFDREFSEFSKS